MHARGSVARARRTFSFVPLIVQFMMSRGRGLGTPVDFYRRWAVFDVCQRVGRASARETLFFCGFAVLFSETGWGGRRLCTLSGGAFSMHASASRGRARATFGDRSFGYSGFLKGRAGTGGFGGSLPSAATLLVRVPVDRVASVQYLFLFCAPIVQCSRTG